MLDRGPEKVSVWKGGLISGYRFFVKRRIAVEGRETTLKKLEDDVVRARFGDPRIHAALNCASRGCPRLPREAFSSERLDEQLDAAIREFVSDRRHVSVDIESRRVLLSKIFDWFEADFLRWEQAQGTEDARILDYVNRYRAEDRAIPRAWNVGYLPYDKGINSRR